MEEGKEAKASRVTMSHVMMPQDANPAGIVHGGVIMKHIDNAAGVAAIRHTHTVCVTASIDRIDLHNPVYIGNLITLKASINMVGRTSMEVGVRVEAEDLITGQKKHTASAYLTLVALGKDLRPHKVPSLILESYDEGRRSREAQARRKIRLSEKQKEKACQLDPDACGI
jgi:acyl-CoA hydrolase